MQHWQQHLVLVQVQLTFNLLLGQELIQHISYLQEEISWKKYREIIDKVKFSEPPDKDTIFIQEKVDKYNKGVQDLDKATNNMFVDDSLFSNTFENIKHEMAARIEALYIVLGYPNI